MLPLLESKKRPIGALFCYNFSIDGCNIHWHNIVFSNRRYGYD